MSTNTIILQEILQQLSNISTKVDKIERKVDKIERDVESLKEHRVEIKSYQSVNFKSYEIEMTSWLYNYLIINNKSLFYYIPSNIEIKREIFNNSNKTITDLDGVIIGTNNFHIKDCYDILKNENKITDTKNIEKIKIYKNTISLNSFNYNLHIIESKHSLDKRKIKKKLRQMIFLKNLIDKKDSSLDLTKFSKSDIYLYFATPILREDLLNFIKNNEYLDHNTWKNDRNNIDINDLSFLHGKIKFITRHNGEYNVV
jgi:acetyltransferase-like isoleucine patch superfamily enzyme